MNLTQQSLGKALESSLLFDREADRDGWNQIFEVWQKTIDDSERGQEGEPTNWEKMLKGLRTRADEGEDGARDAHRYCIVCGETASNDADRVVCLRCRALAMARDVPEGDLSGAHCARCNANSGKVSVERPLCEGCFRWERERDERRPAQWFVAGATGAIERWWRRNPDSTMEILESGSGARTRAIERRWRVLIPTGGWITASLTASTSAPVLLWDAADLPSAANGTKLDGVVFERVPARRAPPCPELPGLDLEGAWHIAFTHHPEPVSPRLWAPELLLASWDTDLPRGADTAALVPIEWLWRVLLAARGTLPPDIQLEAGRAHLLVDMALTVRAEKRVGWRVAAGRLFPWMLAALHTYGEAELREWLARGHPPAVDTIVRALTGPAPLGPAVLKRSKKGKIEDLPHRSDRVVAIRASAAEGDTWRLKATISKAKKAPVC